jgi:DNA-binding CsgD family transcriptional regulator
MSNDPADPLRPQSVSENQVRPNDLLQQRALADALALGARQSKAPPPRPAAGHAAPIAGEGVTDTADLLRLVALLKQAEAVTGVVERMIVIGEFSVIASRVPESFVAPLQALTRTEAAVLRMLGWGRSNADIGMLLDCNENTVRTHMNNMIRKVALDGMRELMCLAGLLFHPLD